MKSLSMANHQLFCQLFMISNELMKMIYG